MDVHAVGALVMQHKTFAPSGITQTESRSDRPRASLVDRVTTATAPSCMQPFTVIIIFRGGQKARARTCTNERMRFTQVSADRASSWASIRTRSALSGRGSSPTLIRVCNVCTKKQGRGGVVRCTAERRARNWCFLVAQQRETHLGNKVTSLLARMCGRVGLNLGI